MHPEIEAQKHSIGLVRRGLAGESRKVRVMGLAVTTRWNGRRLHLLVPDVAAAFLPGNALLFSSEFVERGVEVYACTQHLVGLAAGELTLRGARMHALGTEAPAPSRVRIGPVPAEAGDLVWMLGRPIAALSKEVLSILDAAQRRHPFVNTPSALAVLDSKASVHAIAPEFAIPGTVITSSLGVALGQHREAGVDLVAKPLVGDSGGSVYALRAGDSNAEVILQSLTGDAAAKPILYPASVHGIQAKFAVIQPRIDKLPETETRIIVAGGDVVVAVPKHLRSGSHRASTSGPQQVDPATLSAGELEMCTEVAHRLKVAGVLFAGLDVSQGFVIEINIFNPGGLSRLETDSCEAAVRRATDRLLAALADGDVFGPRRVAVV